MNRSKSDGVSSWPLRDEIRLSACMAVVRGRPDLIETGKTVAIDPQRTSDQSAAVGPEMLAMICFSNLDSCA